MISSVVHNGVNIDKNIDVTKKFSSYVTVTTFFSQSTLYKYHNRFGIYNLLDRRMDTQSLTGKKMLVFYSWIFFCIEPLLNITLLICIYYTKQKMRCTSTETRFEVEYPETITNIWYIRALYIETIQYKWISIYLSANKIFCKTWITIHNRCFKI